MANQYVNKVAVNGKTVLDLSGDTVYPGMLAKGITAHDKSGAKITGTLTVPSEETRSEELYMQYGAQYIVASPGTLMKQVEITKPSTFLPENIKAGVNIGGVVGTLQTGDPKDYIIEQGISGNWTYQKYASGYADLWWRGTVKTTSYTAVGSMVYTNIISLSMPFGVTGNVVVTGSGDNLHMICNTDWSYSGKTVSFRMLRAASMTIGNQTVSLRVVGKWKT